MYRERMISYLPLSHIAGLLVDIFVGIAANNTVHFADKGALKGILLNTLRALLGIFPLVGVSYS